MKIIYIEDKKGEFFSADKKRRFTRLVGKDAYDYLTSEAGKSKAFFRTTTYEDSGDVVLVEAEKNQNKSVRSFLNHEYYLKKQQEKSGYETISICELDRGDGELNGEDLLADTNEATDESVLKSISVENLYKAIDLLSAEEKELIYSMYLSSDPLSERKMCERLGIDKTNLHDRKKKILQKLKKYLGY